MENLMKKIWMITSSYKHFLIEEDGEEILTYENTFYNGFTSYELAETFLTKEMNKRTSNLKTSFLDIQSLSIHDDIKTPEHSIKIDYQVTKETIEGTYRIVLEATIKEVEIFSDETLQTIEPVLF